MKKNIAILAGDGIGPEIMNAAIHVLKVIESKFNHQFILKEGFIGGQAFEKYKEHFPKETEILCQESDAILLGAVGGKIEESHLPKWQNCERNSILALRKSLELNVNIRPAKIYPELAAISPLKNEIISENIDFIIFRELIGDIYFGEHKQWQENNIRKALDVAEYDESQIATVAHLAFKTARQRGKKLISVDKANVLATSKLWREVVSEIAKDYADIQFESMLVDNCAMQLFLNPSQFDVIVTSNLFGDILSDAQAGLVGSLGLMPSASLNAKGLGLYEPSGGSAPSIAGLDIANPIAQILSVALMLRYSFSLDEEAATIEQAVLKTLKAGIRTKDIAMNAIHVVGTKAMGEAIAHFIKE